MTICIMLLTYNRLSYARRTIRAISENLKAQEPIVLHIGDDGSFDGYTEELVDYARVYFEHVSVSNSERRGYGGNYNASTLYAHSLGDIILPLEDDWEMLRPFDVSPILQVLREGLFGCVRMGYIGYYWEQLRCRFRLGAGYHWLELDSASDEPHVFSGHPRLETVEWARALGLWPEGMEQGATEMMVCARPESRMGVGWPVDLIKPSGDLFGHIGTHKAGEPVPEGAANPP